MVDGVVYIGSWDKNLYALDAKTGEERWRFAATGAVGSPTVVDGVVYVGSDGRIYAIDAATGRRQWVFSSLEYFSSPAVADGVVYVGNYNGAVYALAADTGRLRWSYIAGGLVSDPAVVDGIVYVGSGGELSIQTGVCPTCGDGYVHAIDAVTGRGLWRFAAGPGMVTAPAVADGVVYVGSVDESVYAIDAETGANRWRFTTGSWVDSALAVVDGVVYVGTWDSLYALEAVPGDEVWQYGTETASLSVVNGVVYAGSSSGNVYAIGYTEAEVRSSNATATTVAIPTATHEALVAAWQKYDSDIAFNLEWLAANSPDFPRGLVIGAPERAEQPFVGRGWSRGVWFPAAFSVADTTGSGVAALVYDAADGAAAEVAATGDGLVRTGWQRTDTDRIDGDHACFTYRSAGGVDAICFAQRDRVVLTGYSTLPTDAPDAVLMNAADLTQMGILATRDLVLPE